MSRRDEIKALITNHSRRLQKLKEQLAYEGKSADPKIPMEIEDIETKIAELQTELKEIENRDQANIEAIKNQQGLIAEDGQFIPDEETLAPPLPAFDSYLLETSDVPTGTVSLRSKFYIEREEDALLKNQVVKRRSITTIQAPRQTGKSSLLERGLHYARKNEVKVIKLDLQGLDKVDLDSSDTFLRVLAEFIADRMDLDSAIVVEIWERPLAPKRKLTAFMQKHILSTHDDPIILALDEADRLLETDFYADFFGLIRFWYNEGASDDEWEKLNTVLVISTEPHLFIDDIGQSPFNVGLKLNLEDFDEAQIRDLNRRYGGPVQEQDLPAMMKLLNGHPYLTHQAIYTMAVKKLSWADLTRITTTDDGPFADHLSHQYQLILNKPGLKKALKQIIHADHCPDEKALYHLSRAGLIKGSSGTYTLRCDLYRVYFERKLGK
ncbi:MAG: AAA-like domain-containing protein [Anaerolineae bacterium]|nr:AAA-like domain-containing protein [Anaerolineae bacterium]